jgi:putative MATE family efflux protein
MPTLKFYTFSRLKNLIEISVPAGIESVVFNFGLLAYFWIISVYGNEPIAAYNVAINILMISFMIGHGFSIAGATLTGQYLGAENPKEARRSGWKSARLTVFSMTIVGLVIAIFSRPVSGFFIDDSEVIRLTVVFLWIFALLQPLMGIEFSLGGALRGAGDTKSPLIITMIGLIFFRLVLASIFLLLKMPVEVVFSALIADYLAKGILFTMRFKSGRWVKALN